MQWRLFVDESGDFYDPDDEVVVAGVLVRDGADGWAEHELFGRFREHLSHVPWPPHAAHLKHPVARVVWHAAARDGEAGWEPAPEEVRELYDRAVDHLQREAPDLLAEAQRQALVTQQHEDARNYKGLGRVDWQTMGHLEGLLATHEDDLLGDLQSDVERDLSAYRRGLVEASAPGDRDDASFAPAYVALAGETWRGDACQEDGDRYLAMLERMVERVDDFLHRCGGDHEVGLVVLDRHVQPDGGGQRPMKTDDLRALVCRIEDRRQRSPSAEAEAVVEWTYETDSRLAAADFAANQLRKVARSFADLTGFERQIDDLLGLPARAPSGEVTTLAAVETAADKLDAAAADEKTAPEYIDDIKIFSRIQGDVMAPWVYEQAAEWLGACCT